MALLVTGDKKAKSSPANQLFTATNEVAEAGNGRGHRQLKSDE